MQVNTTTLRYYLLSDKPQLPFFPLGLLGLLLLLAPLLYAFFYYAAHGIEDDVASQVQTELSNNGFDWVEVETDGQHVTLTGNNREGDTSKQEDTAIALAEKALGNTWLGKLTAPVDVKAQFDKAKPAAAITTAAPQTKPAIAATTQWGQLTARIENRVATLTGQVANKARVMQIQRSIENNEGLPHITSVINQLTVASSPLTEGSAELESRVLDSIPYCQSGQVSSRSGRFSMQCQVTLADADISNSLANKPFDIATVGDIQLDVTVDCNQQLKQKLMANKIHFAIGKALLKPSSDALLNDIAALLQLCPRKIMVEGHTDSTGDLNFNVALSQARAESVVNALVTRGVNEKRISSIGYGPTRPLAEGNSPQTHAMNRRIEIRLVDNGVN